MITTQELSVKLYLENVSIKDVEIHASCPFAADYHISGKDTRPSFSLNVEKGVFLCFTCGIKGGIEQLVQHIYQTDAYNATVMLEDWGYDVLEMRLNEYKEPHQEVIQEAILTQFIDNSNKFVEVYIGDINGYACYIYPVRNTKGKLVGGLARSIQGRFHMILWGMEKSHYLYGEDMVDKTKPLVIVEGPKDVVAIRMSGGQAVGLMGAHVSQIQLNKIIELSSDVIIWLDNDAAGKAGYKKLTTGLENVINVRYVTNHMYIEGKGDANEVYQDGGPYLVQSYLEDSESLLEILYRRV